MTALIICVVSLIIYIITTHPRPSYRPRLSYAALAEIAKWAFVVSLFEWLWQGAKF
jgi:hypothetical protein